MTPRATEHEPHRRFARRAALLASLASLGGCGSPATTFYTLVPTGGAPQRGAPPVIEVRTPTVAPFLDRDTIVSAISGYTLAIDGGASWAEPIGAVIGRTFTADLGSRIPFSHVYAEGEAASATPDAVVSIDIARFDRNGDGVVVVRGALAIGPGPETAKNDARTVAPTLSRFDVEMPAGGAGTTALVATLSRSLGTVADDAARRLAALGDGSGGASGTGALPLASAGTPD